MAKAKEATAERLEAPCPECRHPVMVSLLQVLNQALVECLRCGTVLWLSGKGSSPRRRKQSLKRASKSLPVEVKP